METRKIQLSGGTTFTVSLPKEWASEHDVEPGASVRVYPHADGSLVVRTNGHGTGGPDPLVVDGDGQSPAALRRQVAAGYRTGRDDVVVRDGSGVGDEQRRAVEAVARDLLGVDVVADGEGEIRCKSLLDAANVSVEQSLHQLSFVARSVTRDAVAALVGDRDPQSVEARGSEAARLVALVGRQFERALTHPAELDDLGTSRATLSDYAAAAGHLERIAEEATTLAVVARRYEDPVPDDVAADVESAAADVSDLVERATAALLDGADAAHCCSVVADADERAEVLLDRAVAADGDSGWPPLAAHALRTAAESAGSVAAVALRAATRPDGR